jgi:hypothetical protein
LETQDASSVGTGLARGFSPGSILVSVHRQAAHEDSEPTHVNEFLGERTNALVGLIFFPNPNFVCRAFEGVHEATEIENHLKCTDAGVLPWPDHPKSAAKAQLFICFTASQPSVLGVRQVQGASADACFGGWSGQRRGDDNLIRRGLCDMRLTVDVL